MTAEKEDCTGCKVVGAGGCFAGAVYALHQRSQLAKSNRNRHWLAAIAFGKHSRDTGRTTRRHPLPLCSRVFFSLSKETNDLA